MPARRLLATLLLAACGPDKSTPTTDLGTTDTTELAATSTTDGTTTGTPTTGTPTTGDGTTSDPAADYDALSACDVAMVCAEFIHSDGEVMGHGEGEPVGFLDVERCILTGLRDRSPGRYIYGVHSYTASGDGEQRFQILVHKDGTVTFAEHRVSDFFNPGDPNSGHSELYTPAQTCTLADPAFFTDCFTNHDDESHYSECMKPELWWSECAAMGPRCE